MEKGKDIDPATVTNRLGDFITKGAGSIDHKALAEAVGLMCMSWLALPIIYWLIIRKEKEEKK